MRKWLDYTEATMTLYVATDGYVYRKLCSILRSLYVRENPDQVGIVRYEDLIHSKGEIHFQTQFGERVLVVGKETKEVEAHANRNE